MARHTTLLLRLLETCDPGELDTALAEAVAQDTLSAWVIAHRLDQRARARRTPPPIPLLLPADPRVRDLRVTPHRLADYDGLLTPTTPPEVFDGLTP